MARPQEFQPEIKFRWCRTVPCRAQEVYLVLTSVTGTKVGLEWQNDLGWYESAPASIPCGFHTGFILIKEKVRDFIKNTLETRERDYKVDPFHIVPHKFAVELFLESNEATSIWSEAPELRLRYLSSEHLERLVTGIGTDSSYSEKSKKQAFHSRQWVSSSSLTAHSDQESPVSSALDLSRIYQQSKDPSLLHATSLGRGQSHSHLSSASVTGLHVQGKSSASSPNLSRAFQVAVDLSRASSRFLAGVSSTSSGVYLGFDDGSDPSSPKDGNNTHTDSAYAAGGETSQESESGEGIKKKKKIFCSSHGQLSQTDVVDTENIWRPKREKARGSFFSSEVPSSSFEDLLGSVAASQRTAVQSELNLMKFETLEREKLVQEILQASDSDFEDEDVPCEVIQTNLQGPYQCVITFESRSASMEDVGSPRALEDVLVSLTSNESRPEPTTPQPFPRTVLPTDLLSDESTLMVPGSEEGKIPTPKPRSITPVPHIDIGSASKGDDSQDIEASDANTEDQVDDVCTEGSRSSIEVAELLIGLADSANGLESPDKHPSPKDATEPMDIVPDITVTDSGTECPEKVAASGSILDVTVAGSTTEHIEHEDASYSVELLDVTDPNIRASDTEDDNFQYDSLKHDDNEHLPIDIRNIDSEESLDVHLPRVQLQNLSRGESNGDGTDRTEDGDESEENGLYVVEGAQARYSSRDGEVPTDDVTLVPLDSYKGTVREIKDFQSRKEEGERVEAKDSNDKYDDELFVYNGSDTNGKEKTSGDSESIDNEESDRSESEALFNITDVSRKLSVDSHRHYKDTQGGDVTHTKLRVKPEWRSIYSVENSHLEQRMTATGDVIDDKVCKPEPVVSSRNSKESPGKVRDLGMVRKRSQACGTNGYLGDKKDSENIKPYRQPKLLNTGTQTTKVKQISRTTSVAMTSDSDTHSSIDHHPSKYGRSPLRNRTNSQADNFSPLPDRLSGPWSQRLSASVSSQRSASSGTFVKPELSVLQRNLHNLRREDESSQTLQNSAYLQSLHGHQHSKIPSYKTRPHIGDHRSSSADHPPTLEPSLSRHASPEHHYYPRHHSQYVDHNHYHHWHSPPRHETQNTYYSSVLHYKYPVLSSSVINVASPSRAPITSSNRSGHDQRIYSGSVVDLRRSTQRTKYDHISSSSR
ncbi:hypothetical protein SK128_024640, partial [Halocaridina rubra]